jgi:hypothetical protein
MTEADRLAVRIRSMLSECAPTTLVVEREDRDGPIFDLPVPSGGEYQFSLYTGEPQIHARPIAELGGKWFWYWAFEEQDYANLDSQVEHFLENSRRVLLNSTRITQSRKWLGYSFLCEAEESGHWCVIGGTYLCMTWFKVPRINGGSRIYRAPAVAGPTSVQRSA